MEMDEKKKKRSELESLERRLANGAEMPVDDSKSEQSYDDPVDEGNEPGIKKKMYKAMMKKKLFGG